MLAGESISHRFLGASVVFAALVGAAQAAEEAQIQVDRVDGGVEIRAEAEIDASPALVWETLTDYEQLPSFIPGMAKSKVIERDGMRLLLDQSGESRFFLISFPISVRLEVIESPPAGISSRAIAGNLRRMSGRYEILSARGNDRVLLRYAGVLEPDFDLPPLIGAVALRSMVREQFVAMVSEIRRRAAQQKPKCPAAKARPQSASSQLVACNDE